MSPSALAVRAMTLADLDLVRTWLREPHVARWYLAGATLDQELEDLRQSVAGEQPTHVLLAAENSHPVGWCQWYRCRDYPQHAAAVGADADDVGIDYAVGDPTRTGRGVGTALVAALVEHVRQRHPHAGMIADPDASNLASRKVLEKNGFTLVRIDVVESEPTKAPMAIYRLSPPGGV
jgi:RimJ/RimL family protein N-acetyltransferase